MDRMIRGAVARVACAFLVLAALAALAACTSSGSDAPPEEPNEPTLTTYFFAADDGVHSYELWKSDGTEAGTALVADIYADLNSSMQPGTSATLLNGIAYFAANEGTNGLELWKSDGTVAGTEIVRDINSGPPTSLPSSFAAIDGLMYFSAQSTSFLQPWSSDGTIDGTVQLQAVNTGLDFAFADFVGLNNVVYFRVFASSDTEVYGWNGSTATQVSNINDQGPSAPTDLEVFAGHVYFAATDSVGDRELWRTDGTTEEPVDAESIEAGDLGSAPHQLVVLGSKLYFFADNGGGNDLWSTTGTGVTLEVELGAGTIGYRMHAVGDRLYLLVYPSGGPYELWSSDGTEAGTINLGEEIGIGPIQGCDPQVIGPSGETVLFIWDSGADQTDELWVTDGTAEGTFRIGNLVLNTCFS